jgi:hypothetical protein
MLESILLVTLASASQRVPVLPVSRAPADWLCNLAEVRGPRPVQMRDGPTSRARVIATLTAGTRVFVCNEVRGNSRPSWLGVVYSGPGKPCGNGSAEGLPVRMAAHCQSGWIRETSIEVLSG